MLKKKTEIFTIKHYLKGVTLKIKLYPDSSGWLFTGSSKDPLSQLSAIYIFVSLVNLLAFVIGFRTTFWLLAQWRISEHKIDNTPQKLMRGRMFN
jgi:hypothetical protein